MLDLLRGFSSEADPVVTLRRVPLDVCLQLGLCECRWDALMCWAALGAAWPRVQHQRGAGGWVAADKWQQKAPNALQRLLQGQGAAYCHLNLLWTQSQEQEAFSCNSPPAPHYETALPGTNLLLELYSWGALEAHQQLLGSALFLVSPVQKESFLK